MDILFLGLLFKEEDEKYLLDNSKVGINNSCNTFQWNIIRGLDKDENTKLRIINSIPCGNYPNLFNKLFINSKDWKHNIETIIINKEIGFINFYFVKHLMRKISYYREIIKWINNNEQGDKCIIAYDLYIPFLKIIKKLKNNSSKLKTCVIIGDLPNEYGHNYENMGRGLRNYILKQRGKKSMELVRYVDAYVLLTEHMKYPLHIENKPYIVIEGIVDTNRQCNISNNQKTHKKIVMYAGRLDKQYGIKTLLEAFSQIEDDNFQLWLCGNGDMNEHIKSLSALDKRIKFFGYVSKNKLLELEKDITVYINPRNNIGEYTKYSFPSKTMEYLASGKSVIMYKLDGIPNEYDDYIFYIKDNTVLALKDKLCEICNKSDLERYKNGIKAREFVLINKNNMIQAKKIINLLH